MVLSPDSAQVAEMVKTQEFYDLFRSDIGRRVLYEIQLHNPIAVESKVDSALLQELLNHIQLVWTGLGESEPHWSVVSTKEFKANTIGENIQKFNSSGHTEIENLKRMLSRVGMQGKIGPAKTVLEYGCGVGRVTRWLSEIFDNVIGVDISASHLNLAEKYFSEAGRQNISLIQVYSPGDIQRLPEFDFVYSKIVLQHNPPPVIALILNILAEKLRPGGVGVIQIPTYALRYQFKIHEYMKSMDKISAMEMHILPQQDIFEILSSHNCIPLEVSRDHLVATVDYVSSTFIFKKLGGGEQNA